MKAAGRRWLYVATVVVAVIALFALLAGGFLWPRPQFRLGPWRDAPAVSHDSVPASGD